jgi:hypothetical protein
MPGRLIVTVPFMVRYPADPADFRRYTPHGLRAMLERRRCVLPLSRSIFAMSSRRGAGCFDDPANAVVDVPHRN